MAIKWPFFLLALLFTFLLFGLIMIKNNNAGPVSELFIKKNIPFFSPCSSHFVLLQFCRSSFTGVTGRGPSSPTSPCHWPSSTASTPPSASARSGRSHSNTKAPTLPTSENRKRKISTGQKQNIFSVCKSKREEDSHQNQEEISSKKKKTEANTRN